MERLLIVCTLSVMSCGIFAQSYVFQTFKDSRVINTHSVETLPKRKLDVRIAHRFGDLAGENGGFQTFFGLESATDIMIGAEYGFTDNLTAGLYRAKGAGSTPDGDTGLRQLLNAVVKYRALRQTEGAGIPVSITLVGVSSFSTAKKIDDNPDLIRSFPELNHRFANNVQLLIARKFSNSFSLQLIPSYTHRNLVTFEDENGIFAFGVATRIQLTKVFGFIADATFPFSERRTPANGYYPAIGFGLEIDTGGHVFQVNFTNATGIMETDYVPYTISNWNEGQFRLGFTISRVFNL
ncbi:MAG: hypothetical protein DHS20C18_19990 [Saprospiraceae bacterium]|nr:MAG: hypothetical protein DHS20C18_19990 [Saprospiraceae bacterium]